MKLKHMYNSIICGVLILSVIIMVLLFNVFSLVNRMNDLHQNNEEISVLSNGILHTNNALIKFMRLYVVTQDANLMAEYEEKLDELDAKLDMLESLELTERELVYVDEIFAILDKLEAIETEALAATENNDYETATNIIYSAEYKNLDMALERVTLAFKQEVTGRTAREVNAAKSEMDAWMIAFGAILLVAFGVIALLQFMQRSRVLKPLKMLDNLISEVSQGNLNMNTDKTNVSKDEIGALTHDVYIMMDVIKNMITDLSHFSRELNVNGDIEYRIDTNKYKGSYKEMTEGINYMVEGLLGDMAELLRGVTELGNGNDANIKQMKGKKAVFTQRFNALENTLNSLAAEFDKITKSAANGDLDIAIDISKYQGSWAMLMTDLNELIKAVSNPLSEIERALTEMSQGVFNPMTGNYKGTFETVKNAYNKSEKITQSYIDEIAEILTAVSKGNLTVAIDHDYIGSYAPIQTALTTILDSLNTTMKGISTASEQVLSGAGQISQSSMNLAEGTSRQAGSVDELTSSIEKINQKIQTNTKNTINANDLAQKASVHVQGGNDAMKTMVTSMDSIKESSSGISKIIKVIEDIAFQTNLLALNAAVEAARAGEHGKGFAVVAEEVRNLAGKSQDSAKDTTALIWDSNEKVTDGIGAADEAATALQTIFDDVRQITTIISEISELSKEQSESISYITNGINEISKVVQDNSATSEECAAASQELSSQAEMLKQLISFFRLK